MLESELYDREFDDNSKGGRGAGEVSTGTSIPAAVFQPPQVVFQPPSAPPAPVQSGSAQSGSAQPSADRAGDGGAAGTDGGEGADGGDGASRRRRRRSSRGRGRADGLADDVADSDQGTDEPQSGDEPADADDSTGQPAQPAQSETRRSRSRSRNRKASGDAAADGDSAAAATGTDATGAADSGSASAKEADAASGADDGADDGAESAEDGEGADGASGTGRRRRRKRRRGSADASESPSADDPPDTVVHVREPTSADDVRSVKGSTRLEAKKQRRREGRETGRRRPPIITESEFLARRESVERTMVVRQRADRTQIAVLEDGVLVEHYVNRSSHQSYVGNVYLGKVQNVLPSMEAAFVDIGKGRNAVLYAGEVNFDVSGLEGQPKRIESALKAGQSLIVQVTKDPVGHKGARLTSQISLPGRYLVYVPGASMTGISRKLPDTERNRLKQILKRVMPENAGVIVRTAAEGAAEEELSRDVARLAAQWEAIEKKSKTASAPSLLYSEPDLTIRVIRDVFNEDFSRLVVAGEQAWDTVEEYVGYVAPHLAERVSRWQPEDSEGSAAGEDVFAEYRIDEQLAKALERKVWLPSGGSLVIDKTEAMTVIDVNTGKFTGQGGNLEETVTRNNLEAAEEIVRQLRLRDVGGIVVIDFIDMVLESNRELVLRRLLECLARDRTKHQVAEVTSLGLVQMTRKRVGAGLLEAFSQPCECCNGRGVILTYEPDGDGHPVPHVHSRSASSDGGAGGNGHGGSGGSGGSGPNGSGGHGAGSHSSAGHGSGGHGSAGHGSAGHGSGGHGSGNGSNGGNGSGGSSGSGGSGGSGGGRSRTRRGSRGRGGGAAAVASPAETAMATAAADPTAGAQTATESIAVAEPVGIAVAEPVVAQTAESAAGELFQTSELGQVGVQADDPQPEGGRPAGRRRRRKSAEPSETPQVPSTSEALRQDAALPPSVDASSPLPDDAGL